MVYPFHYRGIDLAGSTIGIAYIRAMCNEFVSVGVTQDGLRSSANSVAATLAHELGHLLNMNHDDRSM